MLSKRLLNTCLLNSKPLSVRFCTTSSDKLTHSNASTVSDDSGKPKSKATTTQKKFASIREQFTRPTIQRFEEQESKNYYAPDWEIITKDKEGNTLSALKNRITTPDKWEYYNKVVWNPNHIVPETGLPKPREVFHCRESIHYQPKKMWPACQFVRGFNVKYAIEQLRFKQKKSTLMLADIIEEAMERAKDEFHIAEPENMFVAEAFPIQHKIVKGARRHARDNWNVIRYRYIHVFVRLEEGAPRDLSVRVRHPEGWEKMENYYKYLRSRDFKYSL